MRERFYISCCELESNPRPGARQQKATETQPQRWLWAEACPIEKVPFPIHNTGSVCCPSATSLFQDGHINGTVSISSMQHQRTIGRIRTISYQNGYRDLGRCYLSETVRDNGGQCIYSFNTRAWSFTRSCWVTYVLPFIFLNLQAFILFSKRMKALSLCARA